MCYLYLDAGIFNVDNMHASVGEPSKGKLTEWIQTNGTWPWTNKYGEIFIIWLCVAWNRSFPSRSVCLWNWPVLSSDFSICFFAFETRDMCTCFTFIAARFFNGSAILKILIVCDFWTHVRSQIKMPKIFFVCDFLLFFQMHKILRMLMIYGEKYPKFLYDDASLKLFFVEEEKSLTDMWQNVKV